MRQETSYIEKPAVRVYADTSVFGGVCDREFERASKAFFALVRRGVYRLVMSTPVRDDWRRLRRQSASSPRNSLS